MSTSKYAARLLIQGLTAADVEQVQAVVNNLRRQTFNEWYLVDQGPADFALTGHGAPVAARGPFSESKVTLQLFEPVTQRPSRYGVLVSPLRYTALSTALTDVDRRLAARRATAPGGQDDSTLRAATLPPLRRRGDTGLRSVMKGQARVRLRRRPPPDWAAGHGDDAALIRLLMTGHFGIDELVQTSEQSAAACCALLRELCAASLLDIQMVQPALQTSAPSPDPTDRATDRATDRTIPAASVDGDRERGGLAQKLWRELGFLRS